MSDKAYIIKGSECGRDKDGVFHCKRGKCTPKKIWVPFLYLRARYRLFKNPLMFIFYEKNDKRYLVVIFAGLRGEKIKRRFEIVSEVDDFYQHIAFKGRKVDDCIKQPPEH